MKHSGKIETERRQRITALWGNFLVMTSFTTCQTVVAVIYGSMSVFSDSMQASVACMMYAISIFVQKQIDNSDDPDYQRRIGKYTAIFGASLLFTMCCFLVFESAITLSRDHARGRSDPNPYAMLGSGVLALTVDVVGLCVMNNAERLTTFIPWLLSASSYQVKKSSKGAKVPVKTRKGKNFSQTLVQGNQCTYGSCTQCNGGEDLSLVEAEENKLLEEAGNISVKLASEDVEGDVELPDEKETLDHELSSALNVGGSLIHLLADSIRSVIITLAALLILICKTDGSETDEITSIFVNVVAVFIAGEMFHVAITETKGDKVPQ